MMTTTELAKFLGLKRQTIIVYIGRGKIEAKKMGRDWFVSRTEARRFKQELIEARTTDKRTLRALSLHPQSQQFVKTSGEHPKTLVDVVLDQSR